PEEVEAVEHALAELVEREVLGSARLLVVLVADREVVEDVLLLLVHAPEAVVDDDRQLVREGGVVGQEVGDGQGEHVRVAVLVLEALAGEGGAPGGAAEEEALGAAVGGGPDEVTDPL